MKRKPIIAMDLDTTGDNGGPNNSTHRIMNSELKEKYVFKAFYYNTELGRGISIVRIRDLIKQIKVIQPDIVHFTGMQLSGFHIAIACRLAGVKNTLITVRGFSGDVIEFNKVKKIILKYLLEPFTLLISKGVYGNSNYTSSRKLIKLFKNKSFGAIYNFPPMNIQYVKSIRNYLGISQDDILICSAARIVKEKGYQVLCEAIKNYNYEGCKFIIIGDGEYLHEMKEQLNHKISEHGIFFLGYRNDVQELLKDCDIFVLPTLHETLSLALLEASVEGLALIASNTGGVPEIIENNYNGILVKPGDVDELAKAIEKLAINHDLRKEFGANARERVATKFSHESIVAKIDEVYQSLLSKNK